jgi:hypothetical protein
MPSIINAGSSESPVWQDPLFDLHVSEFKDRTAALRSDGVDSYAVAEHLCEASRSILYRLPRLTSDQAQTLINAFHAAVQEIRAVEIADGKKSSLINAFADHIQKRVQMLEGQIATGSRRR